MVERVRPTFEAELAERVKLVASVELAVAQGRDPTSELEGAVAGTPLGALLESSGCTWPRPANHLLRIDGADDYLDVDRLYLDVYLGAADLRAGRQALNWGSAQFTNPTDPFPEVLLTEPWRPRRGVNAVRATVPFGEGNDVAAVIAANDAFDQVRAAGRVRVNWAETDFALVGAWRGDDRTAMVGLDLRGTLVLGWWLEGAYFIGDGAHEELAAGLDYSFPIMERATLFLQYYRNGAGPDATPRYLRGALDCPGSASPLGGEPDAFAPLLTGRDYLIGGATLAVDAELSFNFAAIQNLGDGTGVAVPTVSYKVLDWLDASFSAQVPYALGGGGGELKPAPEDLVVTVAGATADLRGLVPDATVTFWTRASF